MLKSDFPFLLIKKKENNQILILNLLLGPQLIKLISKIKLINKES